MDINENTQHKISIKR